ncbi:MAG: YceI family protein, partial [Ginsengibacter sp.]
MIKRLIPLLLLAFAVNNKVNSQIYYTKNGSISFFSKNVLEDINADNNQVISVLNIETGVIQFSLLNNAFHFQKAKMEEDFNDNYIESDKYPRSTFNGTLTNIR